MPNAGHSKLQQGLQAFIAAPDFGGEASAVCTWLYDWYHGDYQALLLQRFVARLAPHLAAQYLLRHLNGTAGDGDAGLEVRLCKHSIVHYDEAEWTTL